MCFVVVSIAILLLCKVSFASTSCLGFNAFHLQQDLLLRFSGYSMQTRIGLALYFEVRKGWISMLRLSWNPVKIERVTNSIEIL